MIRTVRDVPADRSVRKKILFSTVAGSWYPGTPSALNSAIENALRNLPPPDGKKPFPRTNILILPHAGYDYALFVLAFGVREMLSFPFRRVVVLSPSHRMYLPDRIVAPDSDAVGTPRGLIPVDTESLAAFGKIFPVRKNDAVHESEHACQILFPLFQYAGKKDFTVLPLIVGTLGKDARRLAAAALRGILDGETLLVVSSDFTHFGTDFNYVPFRENIRANVEKTDMEAFRLIQKGEADAFSDYLESTGATICGREPIALMLETLEGKGAFHCLRYASSSDSTGDFSRFVCYLAASGYAFFGKEPVENPENENSGNGFVLSEKEKTFLLNAARESVIRVLNGNRPWPAGHFLASAPENLRTKAGCFVTLTEKSTGALRGCIGEIDACRPVVEAVAARAVDAAFRDPRFSPLSPEELPDVKIEISVLTPEHAVASWRDIEIGKHGMTLSKSGCEAVFLPQVAPEQGWNLETTLTHLALKAGLGPDDWRENASFTVFEAIVFGEK